MANYEATKYNFNGENLSDIDLVNTGLIIPWTDSSIPSGFLECNGAAVSRSTYSALFAVIGTTYGSGNGSTTFNVPDLQDDVPVGKSPNKALASTGGANTVTTSGNIGGSAANTTLSTPTIASHSHNINRVNNKNSGGPRVNWDRPVGGFNSGNQGGGGAHSHPLSANFSGNANSIVQPYLTVIYVIKT
jgi:microcystin-dependent protein